MAMAHASSKTEQINDRQYEGLCSENWKNSEIFRMENSTQLHHIHHSTFFFAYTSSKVQDITMNCKQRNTFL